MQYILKTMRRQRWAGFEGRVVGRMSCPGSMSRAAAWEFTAQEIASSRSFMCLWSLSPKREMTSVAAPIIWSSANPARCIS